MAFNPSLQADSGGNVIVAKALGLAGQSIGEGDDSTALQIGDGSDIGEVVARIGTDGSTTLGALTLVDPLGNPVTFEIGPDPTFIIDTDGSITGPSDAYQIDAGGNATFATAQINGTLYLPSGSIPATPRSLVASKADQQGQIDEIVALLVACSIATDSRVT